MPNTRMNTYELGKVCLLSFNDVSTFVGYSYLQKNDGSIFNL